MLHLSSPNKRLRHDNTTVEMRLTNLPDGILIKVASYLAQPSCISYTLAITNNNPHVTSSSAPSEFCMAIAAASNQSFATIDMKDIQDILGRSLTDNDIRCWVLICIDALKKTRSLRLTICLGITGEGLDHSGGRLY